MFTSNREIIDDTNNDEDEDDDTDHDDNGPEGEITLVTEGLSSLALAMPVSHQVPGNPGVANNSSGRVAVVVRGFIVRGV